MKLTFSWAALQKAFEEIISAQTARELNGTETGKGLWLVSDQGIYLIPNTTDGIHHKNDGPRVVIYAEESNPTVRPFDAWRAAIDTTLGGDDGIAFIDAFALRALALRQTDEPHFLVLDFKPVAFQISFAGKPTTPRKPRKPRP